MAQTVLPLNPLTAWDSRLARPGLHTTVQHKAMLSPQNLRRALCQARSTIRRRVDSAPAYPCTTNAGRNGRKGSPQSYERCQPPYTSTDGSEDPPLFSLEFKNRFFFRRKRNGSCPCGGSRKPVPAGRRTPDRMESVQTKHNSPTPVFFPENFLNLIQVVTSELSLYQV